MKLYFVAALLLLVVNGISQIPSTQITNGLYVMTHHNNNSVQHGTLVKTKIPAVSTHAPVIRIEGYHYEDVAIVGLVIAWTGDGGGGLVNGSVASFGGHVPDRVYVFENIDGYVDIFLMNWGGHIRFTITAFAEGMNEDPLWFEDWEVLDDDPLSAGLINSEPLSYRNHFRDDVSIFGGLSVAGSATMNYVYSSSGFIGTFGSHSATIGNLLVNNGNLTVSNGWINGVGLNLSNKPANDQTQAITSLNIVSRRLGGGDYRWMMGSGSVGGGWGVTSNGLDLSEYPGGGTGDCCRKRFVIFPSERNGVNSNISPFVISPNGSVLIGYSDADAALTVTHALSVNGSIKARKLKITVTEWPDYVFDPGYKLRPLREVESFIVNKHHLPDVPAANEILSNDLDVGDMQVILLKKIEELTLYLIELNRKIELGEAALQASTVTIQQLRERIRSLEKKRQR